MSLKKKLKRLFFDGDILKLMSFTMITKPIGLVTQVLIARAFGAGVQLDAYNFALYPIQFLARTTGRILSSVAIPQIIIFRRDHTPKEVSAYQNAIILAFFIPLTVLMFAFLLSGNLFVDVVGAQLPAETKVWATRFLRFLAIPGLLLGIVGIHSAVLNLNKHYRVPGLMMPLNAAIMLVCILALNRYIGIWSLPAGFAISRLVQVPWIMYVAFRTGSFRLDRPRIPKGTLSTLWSLSWKVVVTQALLMINGFVDRWFATGLEVGSISSISYSMTLINFGEQIFTLSLIVVMFTRMSEYFANDDFVECNRYIRTNLTKVSNLVVPGSLCLFIVSPEIVRVLFQRGAFNPEDAVRTSGALGMYMLGLPALVLNGVVTKIFQSLQRLSAKTILAGQYLLTNVIGNMILVKSLAVMGLAISSSVAINLHVFLSLLVLHYFRNGLKVGAYSMIILRSYLMALLSWIGYTLSGIGPRIESLMPGGGVLAAMGIAILKILFVLAIYGALLLVWHRFLRKRSPKP